MNKLVLILSFFYFSALKSQVCSYTISAGPSKTITCAAPAATLAGTTNTTGLTYTWSPGGSAPNSLTTTVTAPGTYTLRSTNPVGGCITSSTVVVISNTVLPNVSAGTNQVRTCAIPTVTLTGSSSTSGVTFSWTPGAITTAVRTATVAGTYTLKVTNPTNGCSSSSTVAVTNNTLLPNASAGTNKTITCTAPSAVLTGSSSTSGVTYSWTPGGLTTTTISVSTAGTYTLKVTNPVNGCSASSTVAVTNNTVLPNVNAGTSKTITCTAPSAILTGTSTTSGVTYSWSPTGLTTRTISVNVAGTYTLKVTNPVNGCSATATVAVLTNTVLPNVSAGTDKTITCTAPSAILTGTSSTAGVTYSWSPGAITTATRSATSAGTYTLKVTTTANGCFSTATVQVTSLINLPNVSAGTNKVRTCAVSTVTLTGSSSTSGVTYSWTPGAITTAVRTATAAGTYTLKVTNPANSCSASATVAVTNNTVLPNVSAGVTQSLTCLSSTVTLTGSSSTSGATFSWTPGGMTTPTRTTSALGTYTLRVTDPANSCSKTATVAVVSNTVLPNVNAGPSKTITCASPIAILTGSSSTAGVTYSWSPGGITTATAGVTAAGTYTLKVTNPLSGCSSSSTVSVLSNTIAPNLGIVNLSGSITPTPTLGLTAYWPFNGNAQDASVNANHGTVINASLAADRFGNPNKAYSFNGVNSRIDVPHSPSIDIGNNQDFTIAFWMKSNPGNVDATPISKNIYTQWNGYLFLINGTDGGYCNSPGNCTFYVAASANGDACADNPISNDASNWYFVTGEYKVSTNQTFIYVNGVLQNDNGSAAGPTSNTNKLSFGAFNDLPNSNFYNGFLDDIRIYNRTLSQTEINSLYNESVNSQIITCTSPTAILTGTSSTSGVTYSWSPSGASTNSITVSSAGNYSLTATNPLNGCPTTSIVNVSSTIVQLNVNAGQNQIYSAANIQLGEIPIVTNGTPPYSYIWSPNTGFASGSNNTQSNPYVAPSSSTLYQANVIDALGCSGTGQVFITNLSNSISYGLMKKEIDGGFINSINNKVYFNFDEEYTGTLLKYKIYDLTTSSNGSSNIPINEISCSSLSISNTILGANKYFIDISFCGGFIANNIYLLEVINSKNEKFYLKFKV